MKGPARLKKRGSGHLSRLPVRRSSFLLGFRISQRLGAGRLPAGARRWRWEVSRCDKIDCEGRHFLIELLEDFICYIKSLIE